MEIKEIIEKDIWEGFFSQCPSKTFLQSWNWGEFQEKQKNKIWRFGIFQEYKLISTALVVKISARRSTFLFVPHGPSMISGLTVKDKKEIIELLQVQLEEIIKDEKVDFIRISSLWDRTQENINIFKEAGFNQAPMHASAYVATWKLPINYSVDELLAGMRKTTRYLIKKEKDNKDIVIQTSLDIKDIEIYQKLNKQVAKRQRFVGFSDEFIKNEFEIFSKENQAILLFGKYKGQIAAGAMIIFWQNIAFYHQAASLNKFAKFSIPYLLQWEAIMQAKIRGCNIYDFWGFTDPVKYPKHPWAGPTLFKMGFGGYKEEYVNTQDYPITWKYWLNFIIEKFRKIKRGL